MSLDRAKLPGVDLSKVELRGVAAVEADLTCALLVGSMLRSCVLAGASLAGADLAGADLEGVVLARADLRAAKLPARMCRVLSRAELRLVEGDAKSDELYQRVRGILSIHAERVHTTVDESTAGTTIPQTTGDESGTSTGVTSGTIKGKASFVTFSPNVLFTSQGAASAGDTTNQNGTNAVGVAGPSG